MWETWSSSLILLLTCLMKIGEIQAKCERPSVGENRVIADDSYQTSYTEGSTVTLKCATGYRPQMATGSQTIKCTGQTWTPLELQCSKKSCGSPGEVKNGRYLTPDGILFGATATAKCIEGYMLVGAKYRNCRDTGWDGRPAVCEVTKCLPPPPIQNGNYEPVDESYDYLQTVAYTCNKPYSLVGAETRSCSPDGTFQPSPPQCAVIRCDAPRITNAVRIGGSAPPYSERQFVQYECRDGYKMKGANYLVCDLNGWDPPPPECIVKKCLPPPPIHYGSYEPVNESYDYGHSVTYTCDKGYKLAGKKTISCSSDETFQPSPPQCDECWLPSWMCFF